MYCVSCRALRRDASADEANESSRSKPPTELGAREATNSERELAL
jgi:hypothetical protein